MTNPAPMFTQILPTFLQASDAAVVTGILNQAIAFQQGDANLQAFLGQLSGSLTASQAATAATTWRSAGGATADFAGPVLIIFDAYVSGAGPCWPAGTTAAWAITSWNQLQEQDRARRESIIGWQAASGGYT